MRFLRSIPLLVQVIGIGTLILWGIKAIWLDAIPAPIWPMYELSHVAEGLFSALISGYVFYILFTLFPSFQEREILAPYIFSKIFRVLFHCQSLRVQISRASGVNLVGSEYNSGDAVSALCAITPATPPAFELLIDDSKTRKGSWVELFLYFSKKTKKEISEIVEYSRFLDAGVIATLAKIDSCNFFELQDSYAEVASHVAPLRNLETFAQAFAEYQGACRELAEWYDANRPPSVQPVLPTP